MRLIIILLTAGILHVSAAGFGQNITLTEKNISLEKIIHKIRVQTGYDFLGDAVLIKSARPVNISVKNADIITVLDICFEGQALTYSFDNKIVVIKPKTRTLLDRLKDRFGDIDVQGIVADSAGNALSGATVKIKGTNRVVNTDTQGRFYLQNVDEKAELEISYIGFLTKTITAAKELGIIKLIMTSANLEEIVIDKGYYKENRRLSTASVGKVTAEEIGRQPVSNPLQALYGKVPGLVIKQSTGIQGSNFDVEIRGQNSVRKTRLGNGNTPLYVIDGIPFNAGSLTTYTAGNLYPGANQYAPGASPFNSLNPSDIESIEILKDADATSIYGSRGANGVVLITTKKGKQGATQFDANVYQGSGRVTRRMELLNTQQYLEMRNEGMKNSGTSPLPNQYDVNGTWSTTSDIDWQKEFFGGTAKINDAQLGLSGGSEYSQYRLSGGYHKETTVFPGDFQDYRLSSAVSLSNSSQNHKLKSNFTANYAYGKSNLLAEDLTYTALTISPNHPAMVDDQGNLVWSEDMNNPLSATKSPYNAIAKNLVANFNVVYEVINGLKIQLNSGYTNTSRDELGKSLSASTPPQYLMYYIPSTNFGDSSVDSWILEPQISWSKTFSFGKIEALAGSSFQDQQSVSIYRNAYGFTSEDLMENLAAVPSSNVYTMQSNASYRYNAFFSRLHYDYKNTYLLNLTARRDGSSRFGPGRQFANFGAVGAAWIFSNEELIKDYLPALNFGKLRASYGTAGSDQTDNYGFLDLYTSTNSYQGVVGLLPKQLYNPDYAWELNKKFETALELGFFNNRLSLVTAYYHNRSSNQLVGYPLPGSAGFSTVQRNLDATVRNTGIEIELVSQNIKGIVDWSSSFNLTLPKNELVSYPNLAGSSYNYNYVIGEPLAINRLYKSAGVDPETGLYNIIDANGDGLYTMADRTENVFIGQKYFGGLSNSVRWKSFQLELLVQFVKQKGMSYLYNFGMPGFGGNMPIEVMKRWQQPGDVTDMQKFQTTSYDEYSNFIDSDGAIADASFIRLKNLSLSYQLPAKWTTNAKIKNLRLYMQGQNLLTITKYGGLDPETQGWVLPPLFFLTGGIQLTL